MSLVTGFATPTRYTPRVLNDVQRERIAQHEKWGPQHHADGTGPFYASQADMWKRYNDSLAFEDLDVPWNGILAEEFFEALTETEPEKLRAELVQVAAVAVAWIEDIDSRSESLDGREGGS